jgi:hypothetical protein
MLLTTNARARARSVNRAVFMIEDDSFRRSLFWETGGGVFWLQLSFMA